MKLPIIRAKHRQAILGKLASASQFISGWHHSFQRKFTPFLVAGGIVAGSWLTGNSAMAQTGTPPAASQQHTFAPPVHIAPKGNSSRDRIARMAAEQPSSDHELRLELQEAALRTQSAPDRNAIPRPSSRIRRQFATAVPPRQQGPDLQQKIANVFGNKKMPSRVPTETPTATDFRPDQVTPPYSNNPPQMAPEQVLPPVITKRNTSSLAVELPGNELAEPPQVSRSVLNRETATPLQGERIEQIEPVAFDGQTQESNRFVGFASQRRVEEPLPDEIGVGGSLDSEEIESIPNYLPADRQAMLDEFGRPISVLDRGNAQNSSRANPSRTSQSMAPANPMRSGRGRRMQSASFRNRLRQENLRLQDDLRQQEELPRPATEDGFPELDRNLVPRGTERQDDELGDRFQEMSCEEFRQELLGDSIREIALDISPPRVGSIDSPAISRTWTDQYGRTLGTGTLVGLSRGYVIIESSEGRQKISFARLGDADLAAVAEFWNVPAACTLGPQIFTPRHWVPQTMTWKASGLCHKPLYFENIQLERYGHSSGPVSQPFWSAVHFFGSLVTLPYQTAIHPANECRYALGYYRPGNCAPWLRDPVPISLRGIRRQAAFSTGLAFLP